MLKIWNTEQIEKLQTIYFSESPRKSDNNNGIC